MTSYNDSFYGAVYNSRELSFPRPRYAQKNPDAQFDLFHVDGGHQLGAQLHPLSSFAMIFAAKKRLITLVRVESVCPC